MKEILLAIKIDQTFSKDKILELYLNKVYFGNRAYGIGAAAEVYYGKKPAQLTLPQMAMLAGLPQAPSRNNPLRRPKAALKRRNHVLARMLEVGFIDKVSYQRAIKAPITAKYHGRHVQLHAPYVAEMTRLALLQEYGEEVYEKGLTVYTTIESDKQNAANQSLRRGLMAYSKRHGYIKPKQHLGWPQLSSKAQWLAELNKLHPIDDVYPAVVAELDYQSVYAMMADQKTIKINWDGLQWAAPRLADGYRGQLPKRASNIVKPGDVIWIKRDNDNQWHLCQIPQVQGALVALNPQNGAIAALAGGFDYQFSHFNRAIQAQRQPGSAFKPFIYSAALAKGYTLASLINDAPVVMQDSGENMLWRPSNDTRRFYGPTRLRVGLTKSRNLVSIRLLRGMTVPFAIEYIRRFGFNIHKMPHTLSLALGSGVVTPMQLALGYSVFANGGYRVRPYYIARITNQDDELIYQAASPMPQQVLTPQNAYLMTQVMHDVIQHGTGRAAKVLGRADLSGKTGTTNDKVDAWFSGFNSDLVATVWVGFDESTRSLHEYGAQAALPIWIDFMRNALKNQPEKTMAEPADIVSVRIDPKTGLLAHPDQSDAIFELFRAAHQPHDIAPDANTKPQTVYGDSDDQPLF